MEVDNLDKKILKILQENCRVSYNQIAKRLTLPKSTLHSRVQRLFRKGVIKNCVAILDEKKLGYKTIAWIGLTVEPEKIEEVADRLSKYDEVQVVATASGHHDVIIQVIAKDANSLGDFINKKIKTLDGVKTGISMMHVSMFLNVYKLTHKVPI